MRLIDGERFNAELNQLDCVDKFGYVTLPITKLNIALERSAVDAVPVCRCKDCKHRPTKPDDYNPITTDGFALEFPDDECPCNCADGWYSWYPPDDFFCAKGKRKGGDE